ncbi:MAG TPA: hypothetical protein DD379_25795 [Cyanobacteria bacterium UBA11162]|nr:hypothetical protein [Cyanobacteria bacterium UBA11162]
MYKYWKLNVLLLSLVLVIIAIPGSSKQKALNILCEVRGTVRLRRSRQNIYQPVYGGEFLDFSDRLQLGRGAAASVLCNNLATWSPSTQGEFMVSSGCPSGGNAILKRSNIPIPPRIWDDPAVPYPISPRGNIILDRELTLRWNPVEGATSYQVEITDSGNFRWQTQVNQPQVVYSGNQPFQPGFRYWVKVIAYKGTSELKKASTGFTILSAADTQRVRDEVSQLDQKPLSDDSKLLALAYLYQGNDLNIAAINVLEGLMASGNKTTAVYQLLGTAYQHTGLYRLARERFLMALEKAKAEDNLGEQAMIEASLGDVEYVLAELPQALQWFEAAQESYRALGDEGKVQELQQKLDELKERLGV